MKKPAFAACDAVDYLRTEDDIAAYLEAAGEDGDPKVLMTAIGDVIRARNVSKVARDAGLTREGVYKAFSEGGNPSFATVLKVARALDLDFSFHPRRKAAKRPAALRKGRGARASVTALSRR